MRYGGSNPPLCTILLRSEAGLDFTPGGSGRMVVALLVMTALAISVRLTMEPGKYRSLCWLLLAFFSFRIVLGRMRVR